MTFARVAETALSMGHLEHAPRTIAVPRRDIPTCSDTFHRATGITLEVARELLGTIQAAS